MLYVCVRDVMEVVFYVCIVMHGAVVQGLPNLIGRWLSSGQPRIATWLPNNNL